MKCWWNFNHPLTDKEGATASAPAPSSSEDQSLSAAFSDEAFKKPTDSSPQGSPRKKPKMTQSEPESSSPNKPNRSFRLELSVVTLIQLLPQIYAAKKSPIPTRISDEDCCWSKIVPLDDVYEIRSENLNLINF